MGVGRRPGRCLVALALAAAAIAGCGKKGPPVTPESRLPLPASGLRGHVDEDSIVVEWTNPRTRTDGTALRDLATVKLYRHEEVDGAPPKPAMVSFGRVAGYDEIAAVRLDAPPPGVGLGDGRMRWIDRRGLAPGRRYVYVATATDSTGRTGPPSARLSVPFLAAPRAPRGVQATAGDRQVTITWEPPLELADGSPISGTLTYVVLRGVGPDDPPSVATPVSGTSYVDGNLDNETAYRYAVRAVRVDPRVSAFGAPSAPVTATPEDTTPPGPPTNLVAVPSPGALRLAWSPSPADDLALYAVYRAAGAGAFIRIGTALAGTTTFIDRDVRPGAAYRYAVTAIDRSRRPNESVRSNEVTVTAP